MTAPDLAFVLALHRLVAGDPTDNAAWSPYSVASALGLVAAGARAATYDQLVAAFLPDGDLGQVAGALAAGAELDPRERAGGGQPAPGAPQPTRIAVANTLWADLDLPVSASYLDAVKSWPGGSARSVDFAHHPEGARQEINSDVEDTTSGLIKGLLPPGAVDADTRATLVNALYLRAAWRKPFDRAKPVPFTTAQRRLRVPTMHLRSRLPYAAGQGWQVVTVPAGGGVVVDIFLPDGDLTAAEPALTAQLVGELLAGATPAEVELELPRFRVTGAAGLIDPLRELGVRDLFDPDRCDLSGIPADRSRLVVSAAVHKAVLSVDEDGLEGAAATGMVMMAMSMVMEPRVIKVRVDRPFLALVRHQASGSLYFLARVADPTR